MDSVDSDRLHDRQQQRPRLGFEKESTTIRVGKYKIKFGKGEDLRALRQKKETLQGIRKILANSL